jgi:hypothetical protein
MELRFSKNCDVMRIKNSRGSLGVPSPNCQFHHPMNFPSSVAGKMASSVCFLIFKRMTDIEKRFARNSDDGSLIERQLLSRASVKRESRTRPTKTVS